METHEKSRSERMVENYAARLNVGQMGVRRDGLTKEQKQHYALSMEMVNAERRMTGQVLDGQGVATILRPFYYSFAFRLGRLFREDRSDRSRRAEAMILVSTWQARGLSRDVLIYIATDVFNLDLANEGKLETRSSNDD
jgi:hypothetical protein